MLRTRTPRRSILVAGVALAGLALSACGGPRGEIDNEVAVRVAYLGLDRGVDRAIDLGFAGFNAANSANIPEQMDVGDLSGTMVVGGQVDQGASANKGMRLEVTLDDYSDGPVEDVDVFYEGGPTNLDMSFKGLPNASLTGTWTGSFVLGGDLAGPVTLNLSFTGMTEDAGDGTIRRVVGSIHVTGDVTSNYGTYPVDVSL